jgi:hypothetical protein
MKKIQRIGKHRTKIIARERVLIAIAIAVLEMDEAPYATSFSTFGAEEAEERG